MDDAVYLSAIYDRPLDIEVAKRVLRVRMWEYGHSFEAIDNMLLSDMGDIVSYWAEKSQIEVKRAKQRQRASKRKG